MCVGVVLDEASFSLALCELNLENVSAKTDQSHSDWVYYEKGTSFHPVLICSICQVLVWAVNCPGSLFTQNNNSHPQWKYIEAKLRHNYLRWLTWPDTTATKIIPREKSMRNEPWELRLSFCCESSSKRLTRSHRGFKQLKCALLPKQKPF